MRAILRSITNATLGLVVGIIALFLSLTPFCGNADDTILPFYVVRADIQAPQDQFFIDRTFYGNQAFIAFDIFDGKDTQGQSVPWTNTANWSFNIAYSYDQYDTGTYYIAHSSISSNRVYFLGATNLWFSPRDNYFVELIGTHDSGYVRTFAQGSMNQVYSPGADSNVTVQMGTYNLTWWTNNIGQQVVSNSARVTALETSYWTSVRIVTGAAWNATITTQQLLITVTTNAVGGGSSTGLLSFTIGGDLLSSTNQGTGTVFNLILTSTGVVAAIAPNFVTSTQVFSGALSGVYSQLGIVANIVTTTNILNGTILGADIANNTVTYTNLSTNVQVQLDEGVVAWTWGPWTGGTFSSASDLFGALTNATIRTNAVTSSKIADGTIGGVDIAGGAISNREVAANVIATSNMQPSSVTGAKIAGGAVSNRELSANAVASSNIVDGGVATADLAASAVTGAKIAGAAVSNREVAANAIASTNIIDGTIGGVDIAGAAISNREIAANAVASSNIINGTVVMEDMDTSVAANFVLSTNAGRQAVDTQLTVSSNLHVGSTGNLGSELVTNGTFAAGTNTSVDFFSLSLGAEWNSGSGGRVLVSAGSTATIVPSNRLGFLAGQSLWITYTNVLTWTGSITFAVGGYTNTSVQTTGAMSFWAHTVNDSNLVITISSTNGQAGIDDVSAKAGNGINGGIAGNWSVDGDSVAAGTVGAGSISVPTGTVTAAAFSGGNTGYVARTGDTMSGPLTNSAGLIVCGPTTLNGVGVIGTDYGNDRIDWEENSILLNIAGSSVTGRFSFGHASYGPTNAFTFSHDINVNGSVTSSAGYYGNGASLTNLTAANIAAGGTLPALDAAALTNLPAASTTAGVNSIVLDATQNIGNVTFWDTPEIDVFNPSNIQWQIVSGSIASGKLASAIWDYITSKGTGSVGTTDGLVTDATNLPLAASTLVLATTDGGTTTFYKADDTGSATGTLFSVASDAAWLVVSNANGPVATFHPTNTPLFAEANTPTNAFTPTVLTADAGGTVVVTRTGANLFACTATTTPWTITFDSTWTTGDVGTCRIDVGYGTNTPAFPTSVVQNVGRASSTNLQASTTRRTALLFDKAIGETLWNVIQLTP